MHFRKTTLNNASLLKRKILFKGSSHLLHQDKDEEFHKNEHAESLKNFYKNNRKRHSSLFGSNIAFVGFSLILIFFAIVLLLVLL